MEISKTNIESLTFADALREWYQVNEHLSDVKARELLLRKRLFAEAFPSPTEGAKDNKHALSDGWILQGDYKINRTVDEAALTTLRSSGHNVAALVDSVIRFKPEVKLKEWKALSDDDRRLLADLVIEKPGTPSLEVKFPKR